MPLVACLEGPLPVRCHYMSDLHLESQGFAWALPKGDVLIIAGDLCHASTLAPSRTDLYAARQRERVQRFIGEARAKFAHVLLVAGNHDHYDGVFEETTGTLSAHLDGVHVLDDGHVDIDGVRFFGMTLWSDFEGRNRASMETARRGVGEYFFVRTRTRAPDSRGRPGKLQPEDTLAAFDAGVDALRKSLLQADGRPTVVISHHAPSLKGLNPRHAGNGLDGAYASDLDALIEVLDIVPVWVHGHTHIRRTYRIGRTLVCANCRGFDDKDAVARDFKVGEHFEVWA